MALIQAQSNGSGNLTRSDINWVNARTNPLDATVYHAFDAQVGATSASLGMPAGSYNVARGMIAFDTSAFPVIITNGKIRLRVEDITAFRNIEEDLGYAMLHVVLGVQHTGTIEQRLAWRKVDYLGLLAQTISGGSIPLSGLVANSWIEIVLNATGRSWINPGGLTKFGLRVVADINNTPPTGMNRWYFWGWAARLVVVEVPTPSTNAATGIGDNQATANGKLDDDGDEACDCGFEWGETVAYGSTTPTGSRITGQTFSQPIVGLLPGTTYHFRAFATNSEGTGYGADRTFTTTGVPPVPYVINKAYALAREEL